jgi:zinc/manganese transport system permease protein
VQPSRLAAIAVVYAAILVAWFAIGARLPRWGFYVIFAIAVTLSVQLVGLYLVFATLIVPPLATRNFARHRLAAAWAIGVAGYAIGLVVSAITDLPSGPVIVWALVAIAIVTSAGTGAYRTR